jgi:hypothetical protein
MQEPEHVAAEEPGGVGEADTGVDATAISTPTSLLQVGWKRPEFGPAAGHAEEMAGLQHASTAWRRAEDGRHDSEEGGTQPWDGRREYTERIPDLFMVVAELAGLWRSRRRQRDFPRRIHVLGFGANNKNLLPTKPQIAQIYLSSNVVTIN